MKIIVAGSRNWSDSLLMKLLRNRLRVLPLDTVVMHGDCRGVDTHAGLIAKSLDLTVRVFKPQWSIYGRAAGPIRNLKMLYEQPSRVLAFHPHIYDSSGTKHLILHANKLRIPVELWDSEKVVHNFILGRVNV